MERKKELICYSMETVEKIITALNNINVSGITNVTALSAIVQLINNPEKTIPIE